MSKNKLGLAVILLLIAALLALTGCQTDQTTQPSQTTTNGATDETSQTSATETDEPAQPVTMRMSWWGGDSRNEAALTAIDSYMEINQHVTIQGEYGGWDGYLEKLTTQLAAGTAPDIMQTDYQWLDQFFKQIDLFVDLNSNENMMLGGFDEAFLRGISSPEGKLIGAPTGINGTALYMNKTLADELDIDYSTQMTWDRLLEEGKRINDANSSVYMLNMTVNQDLRTMLFEPYLLNITGQVLVRDDYTLGFDREDLIEAFTYVRALYDNNVIEPVADTAHINTGQLYQNPKWLNNEVVFYIELISRFVPITSSIDGSEIIVVDFPAPKDAVNSGILVRPTSMLSVSSKSSAINEAVKFVSWFLNDNEAAMTRGLEWSIPAVDTAREVLLDAGVTNEYFAFAVNYALEHQGLPQTFISLNQEIAKIEDDTLAKLAYNELTPEQAADEMIRLMTSKLEELKAR